MRVTGLVCVKRTMQDQDLNQLIDRVSRHPVPACPGALEQNVLRSIRLARDGSSVSLMDKILDLLPRPAVVLSAVALTVTVSSSMTFVVSQSQAAMQHNRALASDALGFDVFHNNEIFTLDNH